MLKFYKFFPCFFFCLKENLVLLINKLGHVFLNLHRKIYPESIFQYKFQRGISTVIKNVCRYFPYINYSVKIFHLNIIVLILISLYHKYNYTCLRLIYYFSKSIRKFCLEIKIFVDNCKFFINSLLL